MNFHKIKKINVYFKCNLGSGGGEDTNKKH